MRCMKQNECLTTLVDFRQYFGRRFMTNIRKTSFLPEYQYLILQFRMKNGDI